MEATNFINAEAVKSLFDQLACQGRLGELPGMLMSLMGKELQDITTRYYATPKAKAVSMLARYAHLRPTDDQLRRAIDRLLMLPSDGSGRREHLFHNSRQWLAVFKVMQFLGIMNGQYGCMATMEHFVRQLYAGSSPRVGCRQDALTKKNAESPFNRSLSDWEVHQHSTDMQHYWPLCCHLLQFLSEECGNENRTDHSATDVSTDVR